VAIKIEGIGYACSICNRIYPNPSKADACREEHDVLYIPVTSTELNRLINAIVLENLSLIPESLLVTLRKFQRANFKD